MQLPVKVTALMDEVSDINAARETEISVSVYFDEAAPADLIAHVRNAFASSLPTVRMTLTYLGPKFVAQPTDDIAVVVAGASESVGAYAAKLRAVGVPVMVVTTSPSAVDALAAKSGDPIPDGDIVAPVEMGADEPVSLDGGMAESLDDRMGRWIVSVCREKKLAYSVAFPFVRRPLARDAVRMTSMQNAGVGLISLIPGADLPLMTLNQAKMVLQIAAAYGQEMGKDRLKEIAAVIGGAYLCRAVARQLVEFVPVLGFAVRAGIAYGGTAAIGSAVIEYFEGGENVVGVANVVERAAETGTKVLSSAMEKAEEYVPALVNAVAASAK